MGRFVAELFDRLKERGYSARMVSISHLKMLKKDIDNLYNHGLFDIEFYQNRLAWFSFQVPKNLPNAQSLIVVAIPRPQTRAIFELNGQRNPLIIPPTYTDYDGIREQVENFLSIILGKKGYVSIRTALPLKLLAARSGLGQYGRNNICFVSGMGSFLQLVAVYSNIPCDEDGWQEITKMQNCEECDLCHHACPTGAISIDRFLLRAERCISYHNEKKGDVPFPKWMNTSWHNCIIGCMICQKVCPQNSEFIQWIGEEEEFSEEETTLLLRGVPQNKLKITTLNKLENLNLLDYFDSLPRNLGVFFNRTL